MKGPLSALSSHLAGLFVPTLGVPAEAHIRAGWVLAAAGCSVVGIGFRGLGAITRPVVMGLLIGKVQGSVQGAGQEGVSFVRLRRTRSAGVRPGPTAAGGWRVGQLLPPRLALPL